MNRLRKHEAELERGNATLDELNKLLREVQRTSEQLDSSKKDTANYESFVEKLDLIMEDAARSMNDQSSASSSTPQQYPVNRLDDDMKEEIYREARRIVDESSMSSQ